MYTSISNRDWHGTAQAINYAAQINLAKWRGGDLEALRRTEQLTAQARERGRMNR